MQRVTIKQLAEYCRDYIDLVSPSIKSDNKRIRLPSDVFDTTPLLKKDLTIDYEEQVALPISLTTRVDELSIEREEADNESNKIIARDLVIARNLDDIYRKYETNTYTKQLALQFGYISFRGMANYGDDTAQLSEVDYQLAEGYLFSLPVSLSYRDSYGQRKYQIKIEDSVIKTNFGFVKNYMRAEYRDELYKFVTLDVGDDNTGLPLSSDYIDELWTKISEYLRYSDAIEMSESPDMKDVAIVLEPRVNYFLSQDLSAIIQAADDENLSETSLAAWVEKGGVFVTEHIDDVGDNDLFFPFEYDKYQLQVLSKIDNKGMIVEGPPGTGKSQTISNILIHLAASGKKVLFVSQKDQAVRGVKDKLKTLDIPYLFGYIPDRSSKLHSAADEKDSAAYSLRGISQSYLDNVEESDPKIYLKRIAEKVPVFNESINRSRDFVAKHTEWQSLEKYDFGNNNTNITKEWHDRLLQIRTMIDETREIIAKLQSGLELYDKKIDADQKKQEAIKGRITQMNQKFKQRHNYEWLSNEREYIRDIGYEELFRLTSEVRELFVLTVHDRKVNPISAKLHEFKLSKELDHALKQLPLELYEMYKEIIFSEGSKTERRVELQEIESYFGVKAESQRAWTESAKKIRQYENKRDDISLNISLKERELGELNSQLSAQVLDDDSMDMFDELYKSDGEELFARIARRRVLDSEVKSQSTPNTNEVRSQIAIDRRNYNAQVINYVKNRIAERARSHRLDKQYRAVLESIAWKLSKTKKAHKTFDELKSDPLNFEAMSSVTPIWMMGLDDASRILPLKTNLFDYVIIDEASQCNISYTLPVMYRAKHAVFFGDTLQMRDTTIAFKSNNQLVSLAHKHNIPEDLQIKAEGDSVKSVMDIAKLNGFETIILKKHYRSPNEIIGFSNENFYAPKNRRLEVVNDDLLTTKDGRVLKTHLIKNNPELQLSGNSNLLEAYYIKQLIEQLQSDERTIGKSIAVLSFFSEQAELLRRVIPDESVKISAIEGIQGDERDIIIYSFVITSPNEKRRYTTLTGESGEILKDINAGRVNVAFSRARLQVHAVTSLDPNLWPDGIWIKSYLHYIEQEGKVRQRAVSDRSFDSKFEEDVYRFLRQRLDLDEYRVITQVESCGFRIDLVITNIKTNKRLAIECDGLSAFDSGDGQVKVADDYERQLVLEAAHWVIYRIPYIEWYERQDKAKQDIIEVIKDHFIAPQKPKKTPSHTSDKRVVTYEAINVELPEELAKNQKQPSSQSPAKKSATQQQSLPKPRGGATGKIDEAEEPNGDRIIHLGKKRAIVATMKDGRYWFNERIDSPKFSRLTNKGFGLAVGDYDGFKEAVLSCADNPDASKKRFVIDEMTELVVYHPSDDSVDMRQYNLSRENSGWMKQGLRLSNENARKFASQL